VGRIWQISPCSRRNYVGINSPNRQRHKEKNYQDTFRAPDYFWFDPYTLEFAGFHLGDGKYQPLQANVQGHLWSKQLGLYLGIHQGLLRWFKPDENDPPDDEI
jgi:Uma2 family endonuclease